MRQRESARDIAAFPWGAAAILLVIAVLSGGLLRLGAQPLRVELYGDYARTGNLSIARALEDQRQRGFFATGATPVRQALLELPWLAAVEIEFLWPDRLALRLTEHQPLANLADGGVLTRQGKVLPVAAVEGLPAVRAAAYRLDQIASLMQQVEAGCAGCRIEDLDLGPGGQLAVRLAWAENSVAVELGRADWNSALVRLTQQALPTLQPQLAQVEAIDLRYRHAFAVRWAAADAEEVPS